MTDWCPQRPHTVYQRRWGGGWGGGMPTGPLSSCSCASRTVCMMAQNLRSNQSKQNKKKERQRSRRSSETKVESLWWEHHIAVEQSPSIPSRLGPHQSLLVPLRSHLGSKHITYNPSFFLSSSASTGASYEKKKIGFNDSMPNESFYGDV